MELLKDYDITILYHSGKANVVADALSRKVGSMGSLAHLQASRCPFAREVQILANDLMRLEVNEKGGLLASVEARSFFLDKIKGRQSNDEKLRSCACELKKGGAESHLTVRRGLPGLDLEFKIRYCEERLRKHKSMRKVF